MSKSKLICEFYAYVYIDPERGPIYVGKGKGLRASSHLVHTHNKQFHNRLKTLKRKGLSPHIEIISTESEDEALRLEVKLIATYGRRDLGTGTLYNLTDGGEGTSGRILSEDTKAKISVANSSPSYEKRLKMSEWDRTVETRNKIGQAVKKARAAWSPEMFEAERNRRSKANLSEQTLRKMSDSAKSRPPLECPHCGKAGKAPGIRRHHFEYCRLNPSKSTK